MDKEQYWREKADRYGSNWWVNDEKYLKRLISTAKLSDQDVVLDAGIGTGLVSEAMAPLVRMVVGIDTSSDMLAQCQRNGNILLLKEDMRSMSFLDGSFGRVVARNVFHHILENPQKAMNECYRVLAKGGLIVMAERTPPSLSTKREYEEIFKLKDERNVYDDLDLIAMMVLSGFKVVNKSLYVMRGFSVKRWLDDTGLPDDKKEAIFNRHIFGSDELKAVYNMRMSGDDCFIDIRNVILVGEK